MIQRRIATLAALFALMLSACSQAASLPVGINTNWFNTSDGELPLINHFKMTGTWSNGQCATLDSDGWPTALNCPISNTVLDHMSTGGGGLPPYPPGPYQVTWIGAGHVTVSGDCASVTETLNSTTCTVVNPSQGGITVTVDKAPVHDIAVIETKNAAAYAAGQIFRPEYLAAVTGFKVIRFMEWQCINNNPCQSGNPQDLSTWAQRPLLSNKGYNYTGRGIPLELAFALANATGAAPWVNMPTRATADYITQAATLAYQQLKSGLVYVELSNEVWNGQFAATSYFAGIGHSLFPNAKGSDYDFTLNGYGYSVARMCDSWKAVWGADAARVVCVLGAQSANPYTATQALSCPFNAGDPCYKHGIGAVAVAPYFGSNSTTSCTTTDCFFANMPGWLNDISNQETSMLAALKQYGLPMVAYEGGPTNVSNENGCGPSCQLYQKANADPRMGAAVAQMFATWFANGGDEFTFYKAEIGRAHV